MKRSGKMTDKDKVLEKIQKLFSLSGNNPSTKEAQSALLKAQALMAQYNLDKSELGVKEEQISYKVVPSKRKKTFQYELYIANIIAKNMKCKIIQYSERGTRKTDTRVYGYESDAEMAVQSIVFAIQAAEDLWLHHKNIHNIGGNKAYTHAYKNDYMNGFVEGLKTKFEEQVQEKALIVVVPDAVIKHVDYELNPRTVKRYQKSSGSTQAQSAGYRDGRSYNRNTITSHAGVA
jgi:hypothetical protein